MTAPESLPPPSATPASKIPVSIAPMSTATQDRMVAIRSAMVLGISLLATWTVGLLVRLYLPKFLGPARFGTYSFAESFPVAAFGFLGLGVETYIQKEIPVRPAHASDFFGGVLVVRVALTAILLTGIAVMLGLTNSSSEVQLLVFVFGLAQFFFQMNGMLASLLQASRAVGGLAIINVASKVLWGAGALVAILFQLPLVSLAVAFALTELLKAVVLYRLSRQHLQLETRLDFGAVRRVVITCLPYYVNAVAIGIYAKIDISIVKFQTNEEETGWYSSAQSLAGIAMLLAPLIGSVLLPLLSRVASRSDDELRATFLRTIETITSMTVPVSLMLGLGADVAVRYALGARFIPATPAVMILAPIFVLTYLAIIFCTYLTLINRPWTVTLVQLCALTLDCTGDLFIVPHTFRRFGQGGAGIGASFILVCTEALIVLVLGQIIGWRSCFDRGSLRVIGASLVVSAIVAGAHHAMVDLGPLRLGVDVVLYIALASVTGALDVRRVLREIIAARRGHRA